MLCVRELGGPQKKTHRGTRRLSSTTRCSSEDLKTNSSQHSSASSTTRHTDGQLAMLTKLHQRRSWRQVGKKNPITSATVSHARRTSTTTDAFNHHHHGYVKKYTSAQATPLGSSSTSRTTTPPPSKASTRIVASTRNRPADVRQL